MIKVKGQITWSHRGSSCFLYFDDKVFWKQMKNLNNLNWQYSKILINILVRQFTNAVLAILLFGSSCYEKRYVRVCYRLGKKVILFWIFLTILFLRSTRFLGLFKNPTFWKQSFAEAFFKWVSPNIFLNSREKISVRVSLLRSFSLEACYFNKKETPARMISYNFCKILILYLVLSHGCFSCFSRTNLQEAALLNIYLLNFFSRGAEIAYYGKSLISVFQECFASVAGIFNLAGGLGARLSLYGV